jgi:hypothetical protein
MRGLVGDVRSGRQAHQPHRLLDLLVVHDLEKWRLFKLDGKRLPQRVVEDGLASGVGEVGEHQFVFVGERVGLVTLMPEEGSASCKGKDGCCGNPVQKRFAAWAGVEGRSGWLQCGKTLAGASILAAGSEWCTSVTRKR